MFMACNPAYLATQLIRGMQPDSALHLLTGDFAYQLRYISGNTTPGGGHTHEDAVTIEINHVHEINT